MEEDKSLPQGGMDMYNCQRCRCGLEQIRRSRGNEQCQKFFYTTAEKSRENAVRAVNSPGIGFGTLFVLRKAIGELKLEQELNRRNRSALAFCRAVEEKTGNAASGEDEREVLEWMFLSGARDDGMEESFSHVLDLCAAVLLKKHRDTQILSQAAELLFRRNRRGTCLHDLAWAFFQARDPKALRIAARYLRSGDKKDIELANTLLHVPKDEENGNNRYSNYLSWLDSNEAYLHYTGESLQCAARPAAFRVDLPAKYLQKSRPAEADGETVACFAQVQEPDQKLLAEYSQTLHQKKPAQWESWRRLPVEEQLRNAKKGGFV